MLNFVSVTLIEQNCLSIEVIVKGTQLLKQGKVKASHSAMSHSLHSHEL